MTPEHLALGANLLSVPASAPCRPFSVHTYSMSLDGIPANPDLDSDSGRELREDGGKLKHYWQSPTSLSRSGVGSQYSRWGLRLPVEVNRQTGMHQDRIDRG